MAPVVLGQNETVAAADAGPSRSTRAVTPGGPIQAATASAWVQAAHACSGEAFRKRLISTTGVSLIFAVSFIVIPPHFIFKITAKTFQALIPEGPGSLNPFLGFSHSPGLEAAAVYPPVAFPLKEPGPFQDP